MEKYITIIGKGEGMRVYKFAKEFGKQSGDFVHELRSVFKFDVKSHLSNITKEQIQEVRDYYDDAKKGYKLVAEGKIHHEEALKETFNMDENIETHKETVKDNKEQYEKTVAKIVDDPKSWSNLNETKQKVIIEKPSWISKLFQWLLGK